MPFTLLVVLLAVAGSYLRGGRLSRIADAHLTASWLLFTGLFLQAGVDVGAARDWYDPWLGTAFLVLSQVLVLTWIVRNRYRPGMPLVFLGLLLNAIVMAANGAMPVDPAAMPATALPEAELMAGKHEVMTDQTRLWWLADIFPLPPIRTIISVGDVVLAAGLVPLMHHLMTYRNRIERRGGLRRADGEGAATA